MEIADCLVLIVKIVVKFPFFQLSISRIAVIFILSASGHQPYRICIVISNFYFSQHVSIGVNSRCAHGNQVSILYYNLQSIQHFLGPGSLLSCGVIIHRRSLSIGGQIDTIIFGAISEVRSDILNHPIFVGVNLFHPGQSFCNDPAVRVIASTDIIESFCNQFPGCLIIQCFRNNGTVTIFDCLCHSTVIIIHGYFCFDNVAGSIIYSRGCLALLNLFHRNRSQIVFFNECNGSSLERFRTDAVCLGFRKNCLCCLLIPCSQCRQISGCVGRGITGIAVIDVHANSGHRFIGLRIRLSQSQHMLHQGPLDGSHIRIVLQGIRILQEGVGEVVGVQVGVLQQFGSVAFVSVAHIRNVQQCIVFCIIPQLVLHSQQQVNYLSILPA